MPIEKLRPSFSFDEERIKQLKQIAPEAFADNQINWEVLKEALGNYLEEDEADVEHFGLFWPGKREARRMASIPSKGTLVPCPGEGINEENTRNIFIEGENLEVLKILQKSYAGRIKMIYIDPPYNTGNDFVYDDNFTEPLEEYLRRTGQIDEEGKPLTTNKKSDGRFHSKWLSMMYPRLKLARNLLKDDGLIFASIDDNEMYNLMQLMNEVFGEENHLATIANINNPKGRSDDKYFARSHEYIIVYQKTSANILGWEPEEKVLRRYNKVDEQGKRYREIDLRKTGDNDKREDRPNLFYYFFFNEKSKDLYPSRTQKAPNGYISIKPTRKDGSDGNWRWELDTALKQLNFLQPGYMSVRKKWTIFEKDYLSDDLKIKPTTSWTHKDVNSERGTEQFIELGFEKKDFPKPKPIGLLNRILKISTNAKSNEIVLDFFAGSGTTAQAICELNKQDGGNRKFILIQYPEKIDEKSEAFKNGYLTIPDICKERIRRAIVKSKDKNEMFSFDQGELDYGFKTFALKETNYKVWKDFSGNSIDSITSLFDSTSSSLRDGWEKENLFIETLLIEGFPLDSKIEEIKEYKKNKVQQVTSDFCEHKLLICLDKKVHSETIKNLQLGDTDIFICLDNAITDEEKVTLADKGLIKTI